MKVNSKIYKGIEYIQIIDLPQDQQEKIIQDINEDLIIKILIDKKIVSHCLLYKDYESWFENIYKVQKSTAINHQELNNSMVEIALGKI